MRYANSAAMLLALALGACACAPPPPKNPMDVISRPLGEARQKTLIVFLPGRGDRAEAFVKEGFLDELRRHNVAADAIAADAHYGYYEARVVVPRLHDDVIAPARARGYERIWMVGISAGGFGALRYAQTYPGELAGVVLLSPYLGEGKVIGEIEGAGGLARWSPGAIDATDHERALWSFLKAYPSPATDEARHASGHPRMILSYGDGDIFSRSNGLLRAALPAEDVVTGPGYHIWHTWRQLWAKVLDRAPF